MSNEATLDQWQRFCRLRRMAQAHRDYDEAEWEGLRHALWGTFTPDKVLEGGGLRVKVLVQHDHRTETTGKAWSPAYASWFIDGTMDWNRDTLGRRTPTACRPWLKARCNVLEGCPAQAIIRLDDLHEALARASEPALVTKEVGVP